MLPKNMIDDLDKIYQEYCGKIKALDKETESKVIGYIEEISKNNAAISIQKPTEETK